MKSEGENLVENFRSNKTFKNAERENNSEAEKVGRKNSVIWNHKISGSIHIDMNHNKSNQPIPST